MEKQEKISNIVFRRIIILKDFVLSGYKIIIGRPYWKDKQLMVILFSSLLINFVIWVFLWQNQKENDYPVILHYNLFFGVDYLDNYEKIYAIPLVGLIVIIVNLVMGYLLYSKEKLSSYFLVFTAFIVQFFLLLNSYLIIEINS